MVTAEETVVATTTMEADPQTDTSGNSSDSDADKIEVSPESQTVLKSFTSKKILKLLETLKS